jgi:hypothetical protein
MKPKPDKAKRAVEATNVTEDSMKDGFQVDLEKAKRARETAQGAMTAAANLMFTFYLNLFSPKSKYAWNKIIVEQMESNPFVNLQGVRHFAPQPGPPFFALKIVITTDLVTCLRVRL